MKCGVLMIDAYIRKSRGEYRQGSDWKRWGYEIGGWGTLPRLTEEGGDILYMIQYSLRGSKACI